MRDRAAGAQPSTFERASTWVTEWSARSETFLTIIVLLLLWAAVGPIFHFSDSWQLVLGTVTNIVTLLMVFLIQRAQNKSSLALQLKLNEMIAAMRGASNRMIAVEELPEDALRQLHGRFQQLLSTQDRGRVRDARSVEEAEPAIAEDDPEAVERARRLESNADTR